MESNKKEFWERVQKEYSPTNNAHYPICYTSDTFQNQWNSDDYEKRANIKILGIRFLKETNNTAGLGLSYLFDLVGSKGIKIRKDFIQWCIDNTK